MNMLYPNLGYFIMGYKMLDVGNLVHSTKYKDVLKILKNLVKTLQESSLL